MRSQRAIVFLDEAMTACRGEQQRIVRRRELGPPSGIAKVVCCPYGALRHNGARSGRDRRDLRARLQRRRSCATWPVCRQRKREKPSTNSSIIFSSAKPVHAIGSVPVFTHHLIGTSIHDRIDGDVRTRRHARIGYMLEERPRRDESAWCENWLATTSWRACRSWRRAGTDMPRARRPQCMPTTMRSHWRRWPSTGRAIPPYSSKRYSCAKKPMPGSVIARRKAQDLDRLDPQFRRKCGVALPHISRRITASNHQEDRAGERDAIEAFRKQALESGNRSWLGRAACAEAHFLVATGKYVAANDAARQALEHLEVPGVEHYRLEAISALVKTSNMMGEYDEAERLLEQSRSIAREAGDRPGMAETMMQAWTTATRRDRIERALLIAQEASEQYRGIGDRVGEARAVLNSATSAIWISQWARARAAIWSAAETLEAIGDGPGLARVMVNQGYLHLRCGDVEENPPAVRTCTETL